MLALNAARTHQARLARELAFIFIEERADRVTRRRRGIATPDLARQCKVRFEQRTSARNLTKKLDGRVARLGRPAPAFGTEKALNAACRAADRAKALKSLHHHPLPQPARFVHSFEVRDRITRLIRYLYFSTNPNQTLLRCSSFMAAIVRQNSSAPASPHRANRDPRKIDSAYLGKHMREVLVQRETNRKVKIKETKSDGTKQRAKGFPQSVSVTFPMRDDFPSTIKGVPAAPTCHVCSNPGCRAIPPVRGAQAAVRGMTGR